MPTCTAFPSWAPLLEGCKEYARLNGWRFTPEDFKDERRPVRSGALVSEAQRCGGLVAEWSATVQLAAAKASAKKIEATSMFAGLIGEFEHCQHLVSNEAVLTAMLSTCRALGLEAASPSDDSCAYQDTSQPLEVLAGRLSNVQKLRDAGGAEDVARQRLLAASFIVEFGLANGLPESRDVTAADMLSDFLSRVGEWSEAVEGRASLLGGLKPVVMEAIPPGVAPASVHEAAARWFATHKTQVLVGGALLGGLAGLLIAGATLLASSGRRASSR